ncbi:MAG: hypothetical protein AB7T14_06955 [Candidatus Methylacidiphilaceae bacterium]
MERLPVATPVVEASGKRPEKRESQQAGRNESELVFRKFLTILSVHQ